LGIYTSELFQKDHSKIWKRIKNQGAGLKGFPLKDRRECLSEIKLPKELAVM